MRFNGCIFVVWDSGSYVDENNFNICRLKLQNSDSEFFKEWASHRKAKGIYEKSKETYAMGNETYAK